MSSQEQGKWAVTHRKQQVGLQLCDYTNLYCTKHGFDFSEIGIDCISAAHANEKKEHITQWLGELDVTELVFSKMWVQTSFSSQALCLFPSSPATSISETDFHKSVKIIKLNIFEGSACQKKSTVSTICLRVLLRNSKNGAEVFRKQISLWCTTVPRNHSSASWCCEEHVAKPGFLSLSGSCFLAIGDQKK